MREGKKIDKNNQSERAERESSSSLGGVRESPIGGVRESPIGGVRESRLGPDINVVINLNYQIGCGLDVSNEALKMYNEFLNLVRLNLNAMSMVWNPFLNFVPPKIENKEDK
jgi:hypothetical protein